MFPLIFERVVISYIKVSNVTAALNSSLMDLRYSAKQDTTLLCNAVVFSFK